MALKKSKKHFIGLTWDDAGMKVSGISGRQERLSGLLTGLEGMTGKKAFDSETMTVKTNLT